jgi:hypothetical protein
VPKEGDEYEKKKKKNPASCVIKKQEQGRSKMLLNEAVTYQVFPSSIDKRDQVEIIHHKKNKNRKRQCMKYKNNKSRRGKEKAI